MRDSRAVPARAPPPPRRSGKPNGREPPEEEGKGKGTERQRKPQGNTALKGEDDLDKESHNEDEDDDDTDDDEGGGKRGGNAKGTKKKSKGGFHALKLLDATMQGLRGMGFKQPTPIQRKAVPVALAGRDLVAMARTGSGKTAAFVIPIVERLRAHATGGDVRCAVLSPTRELAQQTYKVARLLGKRTDLRFCLIQGGDSMDAQFDALAANPDVLIATPGRLAHLLIETHNDLSLAKLELLVVDEADRLFEMGFALQLHEIVSRTPESRQTLLFSATLPNQLAEFARVKLRDPELIRLDTDTRVSDTLKLVFFKVRTNERAAGLLHVLRDQINNEKESTIVFCGTKNEAEFIGALLRAGNVVPSSALPEVPPSKPAKPQRRKPSGTKGRRRNNDDDDDDYGGDDDGGEYDGVQADLRGVAVCHGSMDHFARTAALDKFRSGQVKVFVVTDLAARGLDIPHVNNVVNFDFPDKPKLFVHRVGRAARQGRVGTAFSFATADEVGHLVDVLLYLGKPVSVVGTFPQGLLDEGVEWVADKIATDAVLEQLNTSAQNAHRMYVKTRAEPSRRSIKRAKEELSTFPLHEMFRTGEREGEEGLGRNDGGRDDVVQIHASDLAKFRPKKTTFEVERSKKGGSADPQQSGQKAGNSVTAVVEFARMRKKKEALSSAFVAKLTGAASTSQAEAGEEEEGGDMGRKQRKHGKRSVSQEAIEARALQGQQQPARARISAAERKRARKAGSSLAELAAGTIASSSGDQGKAAKPLVAPAPGAPTGMFRDERFFLTNEASQRRDGEDGGDNFESHLRINRMEDAVLDLIPDDSDGIAKAKRSFQWDKRKKKFIQATAKDHIAAGRKKSEAGEAIDSKKQGETYDRWARKSKKRLGATGGVLDLGGDDAATTDVRTLSKRRREAKSARSPFLPGGRRMRDELKSEEQIIKEHGKKRKFSEHLKSKKPGAKGGDDRKRFKAGDDAKALRVGKQKPKPGKWSRSRVSSSSGGGKKRGR